MRERILLSFLGGLLVGLAVGMLFLSWLVMQTIDYLAFETAILMLVGGILLGRRVAPKTKEMRLTGRVFDFPQGSVMVEVALRRAKSIIPVRVTQK